MGWMVVLVALVAVVPLVALRLARAPITAHGWSIRAGVIGLCALPATPMWPTLAPLGQLLSTTLGTIAALGVLGHALWLRSELSIFERNLATLGGPGVSPAVAVAVQRYLLVIWPRTQPLPSPFARDVLGAAQALHRARFDDEAESLWRSLPDAWLTSEQRMERAVGLAACALRRGDLIGSAKALISAPDCGEPEVIANASMLRATLFALNGQVDQALAMVGEKDGDPAPVIDRHTVLTVRAHVFAARGDVDEARATLSTLRHELGARALEHLETPSGPASSIARALRSGHEAAYR